MKIERVHPLNVIEKEFQEIQTMLRSGIRLKNLKSDHTIKLCAGVDLSYWKEAGIEHGVCSIVVIDYKTKVIVEKTYSTGRVTIPYIPEYLAFRELPLILEAIKKLRNTPDIFMFDGNGYLHPRHMGIATHASFYLNKPTIGIAKSYFKIHGIDFRIPNNDNGAFEDIVIRDKVYGRILRTQKDVKPIFISCGNYIDLQTCTEIILNLINNESRLPIPIRLADLDTRRLRRELSQG